MFWKVKHRFRQPPRQLHPAPPSDQPLTLAVMVPCFSPLLLIILIPALWNMCFISCGVAVVAKSTSSGFLPDRRSRTAPPAILNSCWCFWNTSGTSKHGMSSTRSEQDDAFPYRDRIINIPIISPCIL